MLFTSLNCTNYPSQVGTPRTSAVLIRCGRLNKGSDSNSRNLGSHKKAKDMGVGRLSWVFQVVPICNDEKMVERAFDDKGGIE